MSTRHTHPLEWVALGAAIVSLSYTEWSLAVAAGAHPLVAAAVPVALDVYAVRAMRVRRHVPVVVLAMVGVNALSYLVRAGAVPMGIPVLVLVSAIAPLVFWAVHALGHAEARDTQEPEHERTDDAEDADEERGYEHDPRDRYEHADTFDAHVGSTPGVSDYVPEAWAEDMRTARARRSTDPGHTPGDGHAGPEPAVLHLALPPGYEHTGPSTADMDQAAIWRDWYEGYVREHGRAPALRTVKSACSVGTDRARRMLEIWSTQ